MNELLNKLRQKPKPVKDQYAFAGSVLLTGVIATIWLTSMSAEPSPSAEIASGNATEEVKSTFSTFYENAKAQLIGSIPKKEPTPKEAETAATTTVTATTSSNIILPNISSTTVFKPVGKPILIATSSSAEGE